MASIDIASLDVLTYDSENKTVFDASVFGYNTVYTWRVDSTNQFGTTTGDAWTFTSVAEDPPTVTYYYNSGTPSTSFWYYLLPGGSHPPTGVENTDYVIIAHPNAMLTHKRLVVAANNKIWYESSL